MTKITVEYESRSPAERLEAIERALQAFLKYLVRITPDERKLWKTYWILKQAIERRETDGRQH